jgi:hypothetical protein
LILQSGKVGEVIERKYGSDKGKLVPTDKRLLRILGKEFRKYFRPILQQK